MEAIHETYSNKRCISGRLYSSKTSEGMEIRFVLINDKIITVLSNVLKNVRYSKMKVTTQPIVKNARQYRGNC
ncbi:hypothetical protein CN630_04945 [Bacillus wiedmannii]|nr:hypothetical protein CN630_04945 [Bacillus wiedmannii]PEN60295.1 hypothetical protein CN576_23970 [Bacillus wiedmannii]PFX50785.1 hypothetical protein COL36_28485 [Bacillus wiedmannii]PHB60163.1 hypothetical protein COE87_26245 [Bacillus wiedmannii]PHF18439.1 hypothetical protein COF84_14050 [Bacillus wiedmannii]